MLRIGAANRIRRAARRRVPTELPRARVRKHDRELAALAPAYSTGHLSAEQLRRAMHEREPHPEPVEAARVRLIGLDERVEDRALALGRDADAGIAHDDRHVLRDGRRSALRASPCRASVNLKAFPSRWKRMRRKRAGSDRDQARARLDLDAQACTASWRRTIARAPTTTSSTMRATAVGSGRTTMRSASSCTKKQDVVDAHGAGSARARSTRPIDSTWSVGENAQVAVVEQLGVAQDRVAAASGARATRSPGTPSSRCSTGSSSRVSRLIESSRARSVWSLSRELPPRRRRARAKLVAEALDRVARARHRERVADHVGEQRHALDAAELLARRRRPCAARVRPSARPRPRTAASVKPSVVSSAGVHRR